MLALLFFGGAYAMWPPDYASIPFSEMAPGMLVRVVATPVMAIIGIEFLGAFAIALRSEH